MCDILTGNSPENLMTATYNAQLVRDFFTAVAAGNLPDELLTDDMTFWSVNSGESTRARFQGAARLLSAAYGGTLEYLVDYCVEEGNRIVAEIRSQGTLISGDKLQNNHVFIFTIENGRIASAREYMDQLPVREKIVPVLQQLGLEAMGSKTSD